MKDQKKLIYWILVGGLLLFCMSYLPYLLDYYVVQPDESVVSFYLSDVLNEYYRYEGYVIVLFMLAVWFLCGRMGVAVLAAVLPLLLLDYASLIKYKARGELLRIGDLTLSGAAGVAVKYLEIHYAPAQLVVIGGVILLTVCGFVLDRYGRKFLGERRRMKLYFRLLGVFCCMGVMVWYTLAFFTEKNRVENVSLINVVNHNYDRYVLYNFLKNDNLAKVGPDDLEGSLQFFREQSASAEDAEPAQYSYPNVIVIMNESWWNTDNIRSDKIVFSKDPMEPFKTLGADCSYGYLTSNIYGGGTNCSEAEFLTGLNTKYSSQVYGKLEDGSAPNLFTYFRALDYETMFIHPYYGDFYSRKDVYTKVGADKVIFEDDMDYREVYSRYISDESLVKQIIKEYEERGRERCFIFSVSVANHRETLDYDKEPVTYAYPIEVTVDTDFPLTDEHLFVNHMNGIYLAGQAIVQLTEYFAGREEPTVIVMFGDHSPGFPEEDLEVMGLGATGDREVMKGRYSVPVLMWSNYDSGNIRFEGENIGYLPQMLIEQAHLPKTDMTDILKYERSVFKTDTIFVVEGPDGEAIEVCDRTQMEAMQHFKVIEYGVLHNYESCEELWTPRTAK